MRILVAGCRGMLGQDLMDEVLARGHDAAGVDLPDLDITDPTSVAQIPAGAFGNLDAVVNCAAYTAVDKAETEVQAATEVNALGPGYLAQACRMAGARLVHLSTDFVFDGKASEPYAEEAPTHPLGMYGRTKRDGERAVLDTHPNAMVVRTAWLYGPRGKSFPGTMIDFYRAGRPLRVVADQVGCPTCTLDLSRVLVDLLERDAFPGVYHAVGPDTMNWFEFAGLAIDADREREPGPEPDLTPIRTEDWPTPAARPTYSVLSTAKLQEAGVLPMRPARESLREFVQLRARA